MTGSPGSSVSWFKAMRSPEALELIQASPNAFVLAYVIASRARWREGFNGEGLGQGESMLGDFKNYGMSEQQYRTAKAQLIKWNFATFKTTNKGTIAKLIDTRLFSVCQPEGNGQNNTQTPPRQHAVNGWPNKVMANAKNQENNTNPRNFIPG